MAKYIVSHHLISDIALIAIKGGCDECCTKELEVLLDRLIAKGYGRYILDVTGLSFAESPAFRLLIRKVEDIQELGGNLIVVGLSGRVERAFNLLRLGSLVPTASDMKMALAKFRDGQSSVLRTGTHG
ncbi:MAG: STAS domain-containing protein [Armatimonadota bacterium]|nr:STAS domain-containing protein [bacterium]